MLIAFKFESSLLCITNCASDGEVELIPIIPPDVMWILVGLSTPVVNNKSWASVPPDFIAGEGPSVARNESPKPERIYNPQLFK